MIRTQLILIFLLQGIFAYSQNSTSVAIDIAVTNLSVTPPYTQYPTDHTDTVWVQAKYMNLGYIAMIDPDFKFEILNSMYTSIQSFVVIDTAQVSIFSGDSVYSSFIIPQATGVYNLLCTPNLWSNVDPTNDSAFFNLEVTDSVFALDRSAFQGEALTFKTDTTISIGQIFKTKIQDTLTSVTFYVNNPILGMTYNGMVLPVSASGPDTTILAWLEPVVITDTTVKMYTTDIMNNDLALSSGTYWIGFAADTIAGINLASDSSVIASGYVWVQNEGTSGNYWTALSSDSLYGYSSGALGIRANFGIVIPVVTTGSNEAFVASLPVIVSPNPATDYFELSNISNNETTISLIDSKGNRIFENKPLTLNQKISIAELSPGIYFILGNSGNQYFKTTLSIVR
jgi:hypothetical protein